LTVYSFSLNDTVLVWMSLLYEALPFVALGSILSGVVEAFVSREAVARWMPRNRVAGIVVGAFLGVGFPMCECGIVPVVRRLVRKGVPVSCAITYMLAAPIVHPLVILSTVIAFRGQGSIGMALLRVGLGVLIAIGIGLIVWRVVGERDVFLEGRHDHDAPDCGDEHAAPDAPFRHKARFALQTAADDLITFGVFLVAGTGIAALINSGFSRAAIAPIAERQVASVAGFMALAILLNVCSEADAFIAASFQAFSIPAKLSFLVLGPMLDVKILLMYAAVFRRKAILTLCLLMIASVFLICASGAAWMPALVEAFPK